MGRVRELLINSEKARISSIFKKDAEKILVFAVFNNSCPLPKNGLPVFEDIVTKK